jgi:hypothetical protein
MKQHELDKRVEETLDSLDGLSRAKANPFLFTRVEARLNQSGKTGWEQLTAYIARPAVALAMLCMVILSNAVVMYSRSAKEEVPEQQLALTEEYNMTVTAFYEEETPEP